MNLEYEKAQEFKENENKKANFTKFVDEGGKIVYDLVLPNGDLASKVDSSVALYIHSLERRLGLK